MLIACLPWATRIRCIFRNMFVNAVMRVIIEWLMDLTSPLCRAARLSGLDAEYAARGFRAARRGLCADSVSSLVRSQLCAIPRHSAPYGARICASGRGFRRGFGRGFYF